MRLRNFKISEVKTLNGKGPTSSYASFLYQNFEVKTTR